MGRGHAPDKATRLRYGTLAPRGEIGRGGDWYTIYGKQSKEEERQGALSLMREYLTRQQAHFYQGVVDTRSDPCPCLYVFVPVGPHRRVRKRGNELGLCVKHRADPARQEQEHAHLFRAARPPVRQQQTQAG